MLPIVLGAFAAVVAVALLWKVLFTTSYFALLPEGVRAKVAKERADAIAPVIEGSVKEAGEDFQVNGRYRGHATHVDVNVTFALAIVDVTTPRLIEAPHFSVEYDKEHGRSKKYVAPNLCTNAGDFDGCKEVFDGLPPELRDRVVAALQQQGSRLAFGDTRLRWWLPTSFLLSKEAPSLFTARLDLMDAVITALDKGWPDKRELQKNWTRTTARLVSVMQTGTYINKNPQVSAVLELQGPEGPYEVETEVVISLIRIPQFQPGAKIEVRVNPANAREVTMVDF